MIISHKEYKRADDPDLECRVMIKHNKEKYVITDPPIDEEDLENLMALGGCDLLQGTNFQLLPTYYKAVNRGEKDSDSQRDIIMVTGPSQAGKTTYCIKFAKEYRKMYPDNNIVFITPNPPKESKIKGLNPIVIDIGDEKIAEFNFVEKPMNVRDLADSLVIFDDLEGVPSYMQKIIRDDLLNPIMNIGRHLRISVINCRHIMTGGRDTQTSHLETNYLVFFPKHEKKSKLDYALRKYGGLNQDEIDYIYEQNSRYCIIYNRAPHFVMGETYVNIL